MRRVFQSLVCLGVAGAVVTAAADIRPKDVYRVIPKRNLFDLKEPKAPAREEAAPLHVVLSGITTILGNKLALIRVPAQGPARPGQTDEGFMLTEGQREGPIEVLQIDEKNGAVRILASGTPMTLTFEKNGPKLETPAASAIAPTNPRLPPVPGRPGSAAYYSTAPTNSPSPTGWSNRRRVYGRDYGTNTSAIYPPVAAATNGVAGVPGPAAPLPEAGAVPGQAPGNEITPEEQAVLYEVQREVDRERRANAQATNQPVPFGNDRLSAPGPYLPGQVPPPATLPGRILPQ